MTAEPATETLPAPAPTSARAQLGPLIKGWASVFGSIGMQLLIFLSPLVRVLSWDFPNHPWVYGVIGAASNAGVAVAVGVPVVATLLPASPWWRRLGSVWRRTLVVLWVCWLAAGAVGWTLFAWEVFTTTEDDLGLGLMIVLLIPAVVVSMIVILLAAGVAWLLWGRARLTSAST